MAPKLASWRAKVRVDRSRGAFAANDVAVMSRTIAAAALRSGYAGSHPDGYSRPMPDTPPPAPQLPSDFKGIMRLGLLNYVMLRWAPKNRVGRLAVEMTILVLFFGILAVLFVLSRG